MKMLNQYTIVTCMIPVRNILSSLVVCFYRGEQRTDFLHGATTINGHAQYQKNQ